MAKYICTEVVTGYKNVVWCPTFRNAVEVFAHRIYGDGHAVAYSPEHIRVERFEDGEVMDFEVSAPKDVHVFGYDITVIHPRRYC